MPNSTDYKEIMSPCDNQCRNDVDNEYCISCFRTVEEKRSWWKYTVDEKQKILSELHIRSKTW